MWYCSLLSHNLTSIDARCFTDVSAGKGVYIHACRCGRRFMAYKSPWLSDKVEHENWGTDLYFDWVNRAKNGTVVPTNFGPYIWLAVPIMVAGYTLIAFTRFRLLHPNETSAQSLWHIVDILLWQ